jgi:hypothetical protein
MPRQPLGKRAMAPAERQQKRRKRLRKEKLATGHKAEKQRRLLKAAADFMPMPPGITYWRKVTVTTPELEREVWTPTTQPLAAIDMHDGLSVLADEDISRLLQALLEEAAKRGLTAGEPAYCRCARVGSWDGQAGGDARRPSRPDRAPRCPLHPVRPGGPDEAGQTAGAARAGPGPA